MYTEKGLISLYCSKIGLLLHNSRVVVKPIRIKISWSENASMAVVVVSKQLTNPPKKTYNSVRK